MKSAYFDNAATTFPKPTHTYDYADEIFRNYGVNTGRGSYELAGTAGDVVSESKKLLQELLGCEDRQVIYTSSATEALNRILLGLPIEMGSVVYITPFEHNAVTRTLHHLKKTKGIRVEELCFDKKTLLPDEREIDRQFSTMTPAVVVMTHASNVCGAVMPIEAISRKAKQFGSIVVVDMSQTAGLVPLPIDSELIDFAVFAGHKTLYAPFGIGGFICSRGERRLLPVLFGGNGVNSIEQDMPQDLTLMEEIGSQNIYAIAGLKASAKWLLEQEDIIIREAAKRDRLLEIIQSHHNIRIVADDMSCERIGVVSTLFKGFSPGEIGSVLNEQGIATRVGLHCAPYAHRFLGTLPAGTVRFSVSLMTNEKDFEALDVALAYIEENG